MEDYRILYRIIVTHSYFGEKACTALECRLTPQSLILTRRRGLLFRKVAPNEWVIFYNSSGGGLDTKHDTLELEMNITDPAFTLYTKREDFPLTGTYVLQLPLTEEVLESAKADKPQSVILRFFAPSVQWEYLFIPRSENRISGEQLLLEDTTGGIEFPAFESFDMDGIAAWRTITQEPIPIQFAYKNRLRLVVQTGASKQQKRVLLARLEPPVPGRFQSGQPGVMRQIYYY